MSDTNVFIDLDTARALVARGWSVVPTETNEEKRPKAHFATAKSWRDFSERLPTDAELVGWFGPRPRRGGVVLHKGQLCIDHDTKEGMPCKCENVEVSNSQQPISNVVWEESAKGWHEFYRCDENARIEHDHEAKIDYLTWGSFVRLCDPRCLIDWAGELPEFSSGSSGASGSRTTRAAGGSSLLATLKSAGWQVGSRASNGWFSLTNGSKTAAISADGSTLKMFSTTMQEPPNAPAPQIVSAADLAKESPPLAEPVLNFCRRGSFALVSGDPKAGKTTLALKICAKKAAEGLTCLYADFENGPALFWHRLSKLGDTSMLANLHYLDCRYSPTIDYIASAMREIGKVDVLVIDCWGLLIAGDGVEDESSNALVSAYFLKVRRTLAEFDAATVILHHTPKSGANEKLCFAGAGASSLQRYVQTIARISQDKSGAYWFNALCREFDDPFKPVLLRKG
ncbi:MAG: AAA family ATPase [Kiritimatiellae bacterium]|nr:AAA family ATPase [Kiritimatiellia bacterium]